jgi:hypothetical protein
MAGGHGTDKKSILTKLFKGGPPKTGHGIPGAGHSGAHHQGYAPHAPVAGVNSSFNDQLMNQTNFGFNPARQTIVSTPNQVAGESLIVEPMISGRGERREINT